MGYLLDFIFHTVVDFIMQAFYSAFFYLFFSDNEDNRKHFSYWDFTAVLMVTTLVTVLILLLIWWVASIFSVMDRIESTM